MVIRAGERRACQDTLFSSLRSSFSLADRAVTCIIPMIVDLDFLTGSAVSLEASHRNLQLLDVKPVLQHSSLHWLLRVKDDNKNLTSVKLLVHLSSR